MRWLALRVLQQGHLIVPESVLLQKMVLLEHLVKEKKNLSLTKPRHSREAPPFVEVVQWYCQTFDHIVPISP